MKSNRTSINPDIRELARGAKLCFQDAIDLLVDALLLFENKRYAKSISLSVLSIEELGKAIVVEGMTGFDLHNGRRWNRMHKSFLRT